LVRKEAYPSSTSEQAYWTEKYMCQIPFHKDVRGI